MRIPRFVVALAVCIPAFGGLTYTCDSTISTATCNYLNGTVAGYYTATFTNVNAQIYISMGATGLGSTEQYYNYTSYANYRSKLVGEAGSGTVRSSAIASLPGTEPAMYSSANVEVSAALEAALGISGGFGINTSTGSCTSILGLSDGCYDALVTISNTQSLYYDNLGGPESTSQYDFYAVVQHETDEVLGTSSCISTNTTLTDGCSTATTPSAVDLFRYQSSGTRVLNSGTAGAYFSYNGGVTNGANGFVYNTLANGDDYADFVFNSCGGAISIQNGVDCGGSATPQDKGLTILNDGGAEVNILDAIGYNLNSSVPEPSMFGAVGVALLGAYLLRRR